MFDSSWSRYCAGRERDERLSAMTMVVLGKMAVLVLGAAKPLGGGIASVATGAGSHDSGGGGGSGSTMPMMGGAPMPMMRGQVGFTTSGQSDSMMGNGGMESFDPNQTFDLQFIDQMTVHHEGAIASSKMMVADSRRQAQHPALKSLSDNWHGACGRTARITMGGRLWQSDQWAQRSMMAGGFPMSSGGRSSRCSPPSCRIPKAAVPGSPRGRCSMASSTSCAPAASGRPCPGRWGRRAPSTIGSRRGVRRACSPTCGKRGC